MQLHALDEATAIITSRAWRLPTERAPIGESLLRVLAEDVCSDVNMPPFDKASMDGYACRRVDAFAPLRVVEHIAAGVSPTRALGPGECAKIMTGAPMPPGADCVLIVERVEEAEDGLIRYTGTSVQENFCPCGEDVRVGDWVLAAGRRLQPQDLAVLAAVGYARPQVSGQPRVGIFATGDELAPPDTHPAAAQIRNSNSVQLAALVQLAGGVPVHFGIVRDTAQELGAAFEEAARECDVTLSTGGVSMGDFDLVPEVLEQLGFATHLRRVAIQPGKPMVFATRGDRAFFGLSGNPVSSFVQFELLARPFLAALQGADPAPVEVFLPLTERLHRRHADRMAWVPVRFEGEGVAPVRFHGSAHAHALCHADGLTRYPAGCHELEVGQRVPVRLCRWG